MHARCTVQPNKKSKMFQNILNTKYHYKIHLHTTFIRPPATHKYTHQTKWGNCKFPPIHLKWVEFLCSKLHPAIFKVI